MTSKGSVATNLTPLASPSGVARPSTLTFRAIFVPSGTSSKKHFWVPSSKWRKVLRSGSARHCDAKTKRKNSWIFMLIVSYDNVKMSRNSFKTSWRIHIPSQTNGYETHLVSIRSLYHRSDVRSWSEEGWRCIWTHEEEFQLGDSERRVAIRIVCDQYLESPISDEQSYSPYCGHCQHLAPTYKQVIFKFLIKDYILDINLVDRWLATSIWKMEGRNEGGRQIQCRKGRLHSRNRIMQPFWSTRLPHHPLVRLFCPLYLRMMFYL